MKTNLRQMVDYLSFVASIIVFVVLMVVSFLHRNSRSDIRSQGESIDRHGEWMLAMDSKIDRLFSELKEARDDFRNSRFTAKDADDLFEANPQLVDPRKKAGSPN